MSKTILVEEDVHEMIINKRKEMKEKHKVELRISDIVNTVLKNNVNNYEIDNTNLEENK